MILHSQPCSILLCWVLRATSISAKKGACLNWVHFTSTCWDEKLVQAQAEESRLASQPHVRTQVLSHAREEGMSCLQQYYVLKALGKERV